MPNTTKTLRGRGPIPFTHWTRSVIWERYCTIVKIHAFSKFASKREWRVLTPFLTLFCRVRTAVRRSDEERGRYFAKADRRSPAPCPACLSLSLPQTQSVLDSHMNNREIRRGANRERREDGGPVYKQEWWVFRLLRPK